jgi:hypothetical protein
MVLNNIFVGFTLFLTEVQLALLAGSLEGIQNPDILLEVEHSTGNETENWLIKIFCVQFHEKK